MSKRMPLVKSDKVKTDREKMSREIEIGLIIQAQMRDEKGRAIHQGAIDALVKYHLGFVALLASKYAKKATNLVFEDFFNEGVLGLLKAISKFEIDRNVLFLTYAGYWVRQNMQNALFEQEDMIRKPRVNPGDRFMKYDLDAPTPNGTYMTLEELAVAPPNYQYDDEPDHPYVQVNFLDIDFDILDAREKEILVLYCVEKLTLETIGEKLGITKERVRQLKVVAIRKLKEATPQGGPKWDMLSS